MAEGNEPKPLGVRSSNFTHNSQLTNDGWTRKCIYGNVVQISGNIVMSNTFPISWNDVLVSTDVPKTTILQICGIVRYDDASLAPSIVIVKEDGLYINPRNIDVKGKVGMLMATYITTD